MLRILAEDLHLHLCFLLLPRFLCLDLSLSEVRVSVESELELELEELKSLPQPPGLGVKMDGVMGAAAGMAAEVRPGDGANVTVGTKTGCVWSASSGDGLGFGIEAGVGAGAGPMFGVVRGIGGETLGYGAECGRTVGTVGDGDTKAA